MIDFISNREEKEKRFNDNIKLVSYYVSRHGPTKFLYYEYEDIMQLGYIGLWKASCSFDKSKNVKFSIYALYLIRNEILFELRSLKQESRSITISTDDDNEYGWLLEIVDDSEKLDVQNTYNMCINYLLSSEVLTDIDKKIVSLALAKTSQVKMAKELHISQSSVSRRIKDMKIYILNKFGNPFDN